MLTCYVDWRVGGAGVHEATVVVRKRLHEAAARLPARGSARASFDADADRIQRYLTDEAEAAARGFALFACHGRGLWHAATLGVPVQTDVHAGERPRLLPLVEATQDATRTLIALLDTNTVRLITLDLGGAHEAAGPHRPHGAIRTVRHSTAGGWSSASYQRGIDVEIGRFAGQAARAIVETFSERGIAQVVIAGDEVIARPLREALPTAVRERIIDTEHIDIRAPLHEVAERVWPRAGAAARAARDAAAERVVERAAGRQDATAEPAEVQTMIAAGRAETLALDADMLDDAAAELLLREALAHRSRVIIARSQPRLVAAGGLAATLR